MSTTQTARPSTAGTDLPSTGRPAAPSPTPLSQDDCPTEIIPVVAPVPTRRSILRPAASAQAPALAAQPERSPFAGWRDATPTEELPAVPVTRPRVSTHHKPTGGRVARRTAPTGTKVLRRSRPRRSTRQGRLARHLRAALAAIALAAAILIPMQLFAAQGISSARQAALAQRGTATTATTAAPTEAEQAPTPSPDWLIEHTGAAYDRTDPHSSPLDLPRCTTSPDTPLPCLATISPSQHRAVVLKEDASLTALVRR